MKARTGFVSNSSSASFILDKTKLTEEQLEAIRHHTEYVYEHFKDEIEHEGCHHPATYPYHDRFGCLDYPWAIEEGDTWIRADTSMDNFCLDELLREIDIPYSAVIERWHS